MSASSGRAIIIGKQNIKHIAASSNKKYILYHSNQYVVIVQYSK